MRWTVSAVFSTCDRQYVRWTVCAEDSKCGVQYVRWTVSAVFSTCDGQQVRCSVRAVDSKCGVQYMRWSVSAVFSTCDCQYVRWTVSAVFTRQSIVLIDTAATTRPSNSGTSQKPRMSFIVRSFYFHSSIKLLNFNTERAGSPAEGLCFDISLDQRPRT